MVYAIYFDVEKIYISIRLTAIVVLIFTVFSLLIGVFTFIYKDFRTVNFYLIARFLVVFSIILILLRQFGFVPDNFFTIHSFKLSLVIENIILSLGLADKINLQRIENKVMQEQKLQLMEMNTKMMKEQNRVLEKAVKARTKLIEEKEQDVRRKNDALLINEQELRQNLEEIQKIKRDLEENKIKLENTLSHNLSVTKALDKSAIVSITDLKGNILKANDIFCKISGYTQEELIGQNQSVVNSGHHPKEFWKEMWKVIGTGNTWRAEVKNRDKNGNAYWVDTVINPMYNDKGKIHQYLSIRYLITDKKIAQEIVARKNKKIAKNIEILLNISKNEELLKGNWEIASAEATKAVVEGLEVTNCELWYYNFKLKQFFCVGGYPKKDGNKFLKNVSKKDYPMLFEALEKDENIIVNDIEYETFLNEGDKKHFIAKEIHSFILYPITLSRMQRGVMAVYRNKKYDWENEDIVFLKSMNDELALTYQAYRREQTRKKIEEQNQKIQKINFNLTSSIDYAKRIQAAILPTLEEIRTTIPEIFILFKPLNTVSGDFYFYANKGNKTIIAAVDCTGHGIPGAFMSLIANAILNEIINAKDITSPDKILNLLRSEIIRVLRQKENGNQDGMDISICTINSVPNGLEDTFGEPYMEFAGTKNSIIYFQEGEMKEIKGDKIIIGGVHEYFKDATFQKHIIPLNKPTTFYLFSDGIQDQFGGPKRRKFSFKRLKRLLQKIHSQAISEQQESLEKAINEWQEEKKEAQIDDMLMLGIRI